MEEEQNQNTEQEEKETVTADSAENAATEGNQDASANAETEQSAESEETAEEPKDELTVLKAQVEELTKQNEDLKDQVLRRAADFENYRKRMLKEKQDAFDYANTNLLKDLLDSLDNFDRTVEAAATATDPKTIAEGVKMINGNLVSMLENKYNLVSYGAVGDAFNPDIHEAIGSSNDPVAEPVLKAVYLKGYKLKDMVIRHAKVMVSMPDGSVKAEEKND
ncbi:MAG: nucleotide exchange factor GrpE [Treponema sp.]|nr:nucleotide exchange factor GrpE [Treponema sp.]